jgi:hypothetical protein
MDYHPPSQAPTSFVPLIEQISPNTIMGETPCSGACDAFIQAYPERTFQLFACASGQSSQSVASLSKGGQYYSRLISNISSANSIADSIGQTFSMGSILWTQGEADYTAATSYYDYRNALVQLINDANTDVDSITGQSTNVPFIMGQCASQNRTAAGMINPVVALADLDLAKTDSNFTIATPMYMFDYLVDNTHLADTSYRILGGYYGYALKKLMVDGVKNFLYPVSFTGATNKITIIFNVPVRPLVLDTVRVTNPGSYGFNALDSLGNQIKIKSVAIVSDTSVLIICARAPSVITYAINGTFKKAGRTSGPRGCLRDSQGDSIPFGNWPLHNWCVIFKQNL